MMNLYVNDELVQAQQGQTLLLVCEQSGIDVPTLCFHPGLEATGNCRLCSVEIRRSGWEAGATDVVCACLFPAEEDLEVWTDTERVRRLRRLIVEMLWARDPRSPALLALAEKVGVNKQRLNTYGQSRRCILCSTCVRVCGELGADAISMGYRGVDKKVTTPFDRPTEDCIGCGACAHACPVGTIYFHEHGWERQVRRQTFRLLPCSGCGEPCNTSEERIHLSEVLGIPMEEASQCPTCKRRSVGGGMVDIQRR